ncbi:MAG: amino acid adenylation domain-containing protein, partial [Alteromonadaceae bacterium]
DTPSTLLQQREIEQSALKSSLAADINQPFKLNEELPLRLVGYQIPQSTDETKLFLLINIHHIAFDGWSSNILLSELQQAVDALLDNRQPEFEPSGIQYKDFAHWQRNFLQGDTLERQLAYWQEQLDGIEPLDFPTDFPRPAQIDYRGRSIEFRLNKQTSKALKQLSQAKGCTLYTILLGGFLLMLHKYTGQKNVLVGSPIANRHYPQLEKIIGFFVNSLVASHRFEDPQTTNQMFEILQQNLVEAQSHQDIPFEKLVDALDIDKDQSRHPIFNIMFTVQDFSQGSSGHMKAANIENQYHVAKFDLGVSLSDQGEHIVGSFNYALALFKHETIENLIDCFQFILAQITSPEVDQIKDYQIAPAQQRQLLLNDWNQTDKDFPREATITQLFEQQVASTPNHTAVVFEQQSLSYQALNQRANQLARYLREHYQQQQGKDLAPSTLITLCLDRSLDMITAILAVLKAGGAYVPVLPDTPKERIEHIMSQTQSPFLIAQEQMDNWPYQQQSTGNLAVKTGAEDLCYVIYTSGTTGVPKGAMNSHQALVNRLKWMQSQYQFDTDDTVLHKTPYVFDVSVWELLLPLISGSQQLIAKPEGHKDPVYLRQIIKAHQVTKIHFVPSMLAAFLASEQTTEPVQTTPLQDVFCSGEALQPNVAKVFKTRYPEVKLHNLYGPTEVAIDVSAYNDIQGDEKTIPIGKPIDNIKLFVLDEHLDPTTKGAIGELYIRGCGKMGGYYNQPELTSERFIPNPFATQAEQQQQSDWLYKTGDLVRWQPDGNLEYLGRNDFQVKIRGFRIELGEIEQQLEQIESITQSVVVAHQRQNSRQSETVKTLVAYYTAKQPLAQNVLKTSLSQKLMDYMIPSAFIHLNALPLTVNGKLDRKALPEPQWSDGQRSDGQSATLLPRNKVEIELHQVWRELLAVENLAIEDNFFNIGGDSILSIQLANNIRMAGYQCGVKNIFDHPTIAALAQYLAGDKVTAKTGTTAQYWQSIGNQLPNYKVEVYQQKLKQKLSWDGQQFEQANRAYHSQTQDLLLTAIVYALSEWQNQQRLAIKIPAPAILNIQAQIGDTIRHVKEVTRTLVDSDGYQDIQVPVQFAQGSIELQSPQYLSFGYVQSDANVELTIESCLAPHIHQQLIDGINTYLERICSHCDAKCQSGEIEYTFSDFQRQELFVQVNEDLQDQPAIFLLPPGGGGAESYFNNLVPQLSNQRLVLFNNIFSYLHKVQQSDTLDHYDYQMLAAQYIVWIKHIQPTGPYQFIGWSFGGTLGLEVTRQLTQAGDEVENLVIIDSYFNLKKAFECVEHQSVTIEQDNSEENLNYRYDISDDPLTTNTKVTLFRATQLLELEQVKRQHNLSDAQVEQTKVINHHYVHATKDNYISDFVHNDHIEVVNLQSNHTSWIDNDQDIALMSARLQALFE